MSLTDLRGWPTGLCILFVVSISLASPSEVSAASQQQGVQIPGGGPVRTITTVFTVDLLKGVQNGQDPRPPNDGSYDLAILKFKDDGDLVDMRHLSAATQCITNARRNPNGAVVLVFVHGWHHNANWDIATDSGDSHFRAFRQILRAMATREAERYTPEPAGRRVVGVYIGWNGDPPDSWVTKAGPLTHLSFWNRSETSKRIGNGNDLRRALQEIVSNTKGTSPSEVGPNFPESPLILIGHSMGAQMLESAFLSLLKDSKHPLVHEPATDARLVQVRRAGQRVSFPDVVIALNSAADSTIHKQIRSILDSEQYTKSLETKTVRYAPPLLISATSSADDDTKVIWRAANLQWPGRTTDGHDSSLYTHTFALTMPAVSCPPRGRVDFGQNWHCLRPPIPPNTATPEIAIDLPTRERTGPSDQPPFARYTLKPINDVKVPHLTWVFLVPPEIISDHNDIFNSRSSSLILGLIQLSGAVMSLAYDLDTTFEY
jgi:hypothetical protein